MGKRRESSSLCYRLHVVFDVSLRSFLLEKAALFYYDTPWACHKTIWHWWPLDFKATPSAGYSYL